MNSKLNLKVCTWNDVHNPGSEAASNGECVESGADWLDLECTSIRELAETFCEEVERRSYYEPVDCYCNDVLYFIAPQIDYSSGDEYYDRVSILIEWADSDAYLKPGLVAYRDRVVRAVNYLIDKRLEV